MNTPTQVKPVVLCRPDNTDAIPLELRQRKQWVVWAYKWVARDGKWAKVPFNPASEQQASSTDPLTWGAFTQAAARFVRGAFDGFGFVVTADDPYVGVDLDKCRDPRTGKIEPWALEIVKRLDSYAEVSPSGTGVRIWCKGTLPPVGRRRGQVEMYEDERYLTLTGQHIAGTPALINERTEALGAVHAAHLAPKRSATPAPPPPVDGPRLSGAEVLKKAQNARNGARFNALWNGDTSDYGGDDSVADAALLGQLAFWCRGDRVQMARLFERSKLCRPKWLNRADYRERTIAHVLAGQTDFYSPPPATAQSAPPAPTPEAQAAAEEAPAPQSRKELAIEQATLGAILKDPENVVTFATLLQPGDFLLTKHNWIYEAINDLHQRRLVPDLITVEAELIGRGRLEAVGGTTYLDRLIAAAATAERAVQYAGIIERGASGRRLAEAGRAIEALAGEQTDDPEAAYDRAQGLILEALGTRSRKGIQKVQNTLGALIDELEVLAQLDDGALTGVTTGFTLLDQLTGGWQKGDLILIGGVSKGGKTSLGSDFIYAAIHAGVETLLFSAEMSLRQTGLRALSTHSGINLQRLRTGKIAEHEWKRLSDAYGRIGGAAGFWVDDTRGLHISEMRNRARQMKLAHPEIGLIVVDYLQLFNGTRNKNDSKTNEIASVSEGLKALAGELGVPVIALVQLNRELYRRENKRPTAADIRDSGNPYQDADLVLFVHRPHMFDPSAPEHQGEIIIDAARMGPTGIVPVTWVPEITHFEE